MNQHLRGPMIPKMDTDKQKLSTPLRCWFIICINIMIFTYVSIFQLNSYVNLIICTTIMNQHLRGAMIPKMDTDKQKLSRPADVDLLYSFI
ncbi:MAG: hypothetical protein Satyrvirus24_4 [Satyrvirus sp.]|uniref:Uncharacterized protein n=1 Tax=Satyrvirus sp. TaxID=2487771 RepID=A0A3G5AEG8_9VIRU|nr:MAG: hypothetical protein Satyrvirus24_4 [Satyrvirus sp.]